MALASLRRLIRTRPAGWLLALALVWLPAAQWAAAAHAFLHLRAASAANSGEQPGHLPTSCDICIVAASIGGGGAPPTQPVASLPPPPPQVLLALPVVQLVSLAPPAHYRSRAPPLSHA